MHRMIVSALLLFAVSSLTVVSADATERASSAESSTTASFSKAGAGIGTRSSRLPVIVSSELVAQDVCRLHFEGGSSLDVTCNGRSFNIR